jgi:arabinan endo-1,5-alpha-L-arabinosidase
MPKTADAPSRVRSSSTFKSWLMVGAIGLSLLIPSGFTQSKIALPTLIEPTGDIHAHDPSMIKAGGVYYVFATGDEGGLNDGSLQIRKSSDMRDWSFVGTVFETTPKWITKEIGKVPNLWAPDISYANGRYVLYYAASHFGTNESVIGLATNATLDPKNPKYKWLDQGLVIRSRAGTDNWNAIDPNRVVDAQGRAWLSFGSYWDGIKMRLLDPKTGKLSSQDSSLYSLASRSGGAIEAPSIVSHGGFYYLFVSFDACCRGADSTYKIMIGRSKNITGPYLDRDGLPMQKGGGSLVLEGHDRVRGPGGQTVHNDDGTFRMIYHYYDGAVFGEIKFLIQTLSWTSDGWPSLR